ncbi:MAG: hydantoinase B/oxoprolinase family protein, partial [Candidatus Lambdaproteobacteria bacterium]|nr:hydantoinase B/oxoprolinase family protein [Candidatus Lambdaproteobacteria bacterium]
ISGALAGVLPRRAMAGFSHWSNPVSGGVDERSGRSFIYYDLIYGGYGARAHGDGPEALCPVFNATNIPVEVHEAHSPVLVRRLELMPDTGGAGQFRGGCGVRKDVELRTAAATVSLSGDRHRHQPLGLFGGRPGALARTVLNPDTDREEALASKAVRTLTRGDVLSIQLSGGGGYGDPAQRDPAAIARDIAEGYVTPQAAKREYGTHVPEV